MSSNPANPIAITVFDMARVLPRLGVAPQYHRPGRLKAFSATSRCSPPFETVDSNPATRATRSQERPTPCLARKTVIASPGSRGVVASARTPVFPGRPPQARLPRILDVPVGFRPRLGCGLAVRFVQDRPIASSVEHHDLPDPDPFPEPVETFVDLVELRLSGWGGPAVTVVPPRARRRNRKCNLVPKFRKPLSKNLCPRARSTS